MSTTPDDQLRAALNQRAASFDTTGVTMESISQRATTLKRRRTAATIGGAALALAVIVPVGILGSNALRDSDSNVPVATGSPDPTVTSNPTDAPDKRTIDAKLDLANLPTGDRPYVAFTENGVVPSDYDPIDLGKDVQDFVLSSGGGEQQVFTTVTNDNRGNRVVNFGDQQWTLDNHGSVVTDGNGHVAWVDADGNVRVLDTLSGATPTAETWGDGSLVKAVTITCPDGECTVIANSLGSAYEVTSDGMLPTGTDPLSATSADLFVGITSTSDDGSCSAALSRDTGDKAWSTCDNRFFKFSPDGQHLVGAGAYGDGFADGELALVDANTGEVSASWLSIQDYGVGFLDSVWEDNSHVLAVIATWEDGGKWAIVRLGIDGSAEFAIPPVSASTEDRPFFLATQP